MCNAESLALRVAKVAEVKLLDRVIGVLGEIVQEENNCVPITSDSVLTQATHGWKIRFKEADY